MALEKQPDVPPASTASSASKADFGEDVRQAERTLDRVEELVGEALGPDAELNDAVWQLTLAQWNLGRYDSFRRQWPRQAAMLVASMATIVYLVYRFIWTMNLATVPAGVFSGILLAAEVYAGISLGLYFFQVWRLVEPPIRRPTARRTVDVFVATYNEDVSLLRGTLSACLDMDYPHTTYVLDDGARDEVRKLAEELGVRYISRTDRTHAKAGNLNHAMRRTDGEFVAVFDADHLPYRHFITRLIGYFDDPRMGFVQVPHTTYNLDNFMGRWKSASKAYWEDVRIFFEAVQLGKNRFGVACFCGSAAIFRRKAVEDVGLFATETITEDMHTGMRINAAGWKSIAVSEEMVVGLAPDDAVTFVNQRLRWGEGNLSVMAYDNPLTMKGLTLAGRINYLASIACWTMGPARLILYLTPLVMLLTGVAPVADMSVSYFVVVGCYLAAVWTAVKAASNGCGQLIGIEMAMMASFHLQLQALWRAFFRRRRQQFVVTPKRQLGDKQRSGLRRMWPQAALVVVSIVAVSWATARVLFGLSEDYFGLTVGSGLAAYHGWLALYVLGRTAVKRSPDEQWRHPLCLAVDYSTPAGISSGTSVEFNENGCRLLTWECLELGPIILELHSPVKEMTCEGRVTASMPVGRGRPLAYLSNIMFEYDNPVLKEHQDDLLREIILQYVVPVVTMAHHLVHQGARALPEEISGEGDFPIPLVIEPNQPDLTSQRSVALSIGKEGFLAALPVPCAIGNMVQATLNTPLGPITADVRIHDVETLRFGTTIIQQHEFHWSDPAVVRRIASREKRWKKSLRRAMSQMRYHRQSTRRSVLVSLAGCFIAMATAFLFGQLHHEDILFARLIRPRPTVAQRDRAQAAAERLGDLSSSSANQLLRIYRAAVTLGNDSLAADAAKHLADRVKTGRCDWLLTQARHLARANDHQAAAEAFDRLLADLTIYTLPLEEQANIYIEAARASVAISDYDQAVERFLQACNFKAVDPQQAEELLGVLITAKQARLAVQVLRQLDPTDQVIKRIVDVYEIADQAQMAVPELEELHRRHPNDANVVRRLAELAVVRRDFAAGLSYYRTLYAREPGNDKIRKKLAETMLLEAREDVAAKRYDKAQSLFNESFRLEPPDEKLKREYAGLLATTGHFDQAVALLEPFGDTESRMQLAAVLEMQGNRARALQILLALENTRPLDEKAKRSIARLLLANRQYEQAASRLVDLLKTEPEDLEIQREYLDAVAAAKDWTDEVRQTLGNVYRRYQETGFRGLDASGYERLGESLRRLGMLEQARLVLHRAVNVFPDTRRLRFYLAQTLGSLGRYDDAEVQYKLLLDTRLKPHD